MKVALLAACLLVGAGTSCTADGIDPLPAPPTTRPRPPTTVAPDYSKVALAAVPGRTTTTVPVTGGDATIEGSVVGPDGPVAGAVVHVERLVADYTAVVDLVSNPDGTFALPDVHGGRYRVRAYLPPDLAQVKPEVFFLSGDEEKALTLKMERYEGVSVAAAVAPNPPVPTEPANLLVQATLRSVDAYGVVRAVPVPGVRLELFPTGRWTIDSDQVQYADDSGRAVWRVRCGRQGEQRMSVLVGDGEEFELSLPACSEPPPPSTTTTTSRPRRTTTSTSTSSTTSSSTTSSTSSSSTTSTTVDDGNNGRGND
jgi:hypothetical protein